MKEPIKKTVSLYDGKINIEFNSLARNRYVVLEDGHSPVGVTTILSQLSKPGLALWPMYECIEWLKRHAEDYEGAEKAYLIKSDSGKDIGTRTHAWIEKYLTYPDEVFGWDKDIEKPVNAFDRWFQQAQPKVLATEQIVYSKVYDYAGTYDALLEIDGKVVLCDVKTTNTSRAAPLGVYPEMFLQLGAYSLAHHEENPQEEIDDVMVVRVGKDGVLNTLRASELGFKLAYLQETFKQLVTLYRFMTPLTKTLKGMEVKPDVAKV